MFDDRERAVLAYTDALVGADGRVPDALFEELRTHLSDEEILELTYITAMYEMHAIMSKALRVEFDDRDDPIVEIAGDAVFARRRRRSDDQQGGCLRWTSRGHDLTGEVEAIAGEWRSARSERQARRAPRRRRTSPG